MRPVPLTDSFRASLPEHRAIVIAAPDGDLTNELIAPVEAAVYVDDFPDPVRMVAVEIALEDGDLDRLAAGGHVILTFLGVSAIPVFSVYTTEGNPQ